MRLLRIGAVAWIASFAGDARAQPAPDAWIEPHVALAPYGPPGDSGRGLGLGARGVFVFARDGFAPTLDDSAALSVGVDVLRYRLTDSLGSRCDRFDRNRRSVLMRL